MPLHETGNSIKARTGFNVLLCPQCRKMSMNLHSDFIGRKQDEQ